MKRSYFLYGLVFFLVSCELFNTQKITKETFYEEGVKDITWNEIDTYPIFPECTSEIDKLPQQQCFLNVIRSQMQSQLTSNQVEAFHEISDTLALTLAINSEGEMQLMNIEADSVLLSKIPRLKEILNSGIDQLSKPQPATKQGIPVATQLTLPIVIETNPAID